MACAEPTRGREATTSRPLLLSAVGRVTQGGRQKSFAADDHARGFGLRTAAADTGKPFPERAEEYCGAVESGRKLGADLESDSVSVAVSEGSDPGEERLNPGFAV